jgi:hypothetical protein
MIFPKERVLNTKGINYVFFSGFPKLYFREVKA